jgi:hypothetical protein
MELYLNLFNKKRKPPIVSKSGTIVLPLKNHQYLALNEKGNIIWRVSPQNQFHQPLKHVGTPVFRQDETCIIISMRSIGCLNVKGEYVWRKIIDGMPEAPNINNEGHIYVSAWSFNWAGLYLLSEKGISIHANDPVLSAKWLGGKNIQVNPVVIDEQNRVFLRYRDNIAKHEAYSWDPPDEV